MPARLFRLCFTIPLLIAGFSAPPAGAALSCEARSGALAASLIELYTSEGCDSCPPADRWLGGLASEVAAGTAVALAFHVDYWDHLGWRDPYASALFSERQRRRAATAGAGFVYTPQVLVNGRDFRLWQGPDWRAALRGAARREPAADLAIQLEQGAGGAWQARIEASPRRPLAAARAWLVQYENGLSSDIAAGENRGKRLRHDFVARRLLGPVAADRDGRLRLESRLPPGGAGGVAAFVEDAASGEVLQALALPYCASPGKGGGPPLPR